MSRRGAGWRGLRAAGAALIALGALYVALPWWAPVGWLARRIEGQLSGDLQRRVTIGRMSLGWVQGVVVEDVTINDLPGAPNPYLACIARVHCELAPLRMLLDGKVARLDVTGPALWLVRGQDGKLNVDELVVRRNQRLPAHEFVVREATCHVWSPQSQQVLRIDTAQCRLDLERARLDVSALTVVPSVGRMDDVVAARRLAVDAHLIVPKLRRDLELRLSGAVRMEWTNLRLTDLPLALIPALPVEQAGGATSGMLSFETHPDLSIDFSQRIELAGVQLMWAGMTRRAVVPDALFSCHGHWDPATDHLRIRGLDYETQAVHVRTPPGTAIEVDPGGRTSLAVALAGEIKDWRLLRREVPQFDQAATELGLDLAGQATFALETSRSGDEGQIALTLDGRQSRWTVLRGSERCFEVSEGLDKTLELTAGGDFRSRTVRPSLRMQLGELSATLSGKGRVRGERDARPPAGWEELTADLELHTRQVERVLAMFPPIAAFHELADWRGPMSAKLKLAPAPGGSRADVEVAADAEATLSWREWFEKPVGAPLLLTAGLTVPHARAGRVDDVGFSVGYRGGAISIAPGQAQVRYRLGGQDDLDAEATFSAAIEHAEDWVGLCPRWRAATAAEPERAVAGSMRAEARVEATRRPGEAMTSVTASLDVGGLGVRWGPGLDKPAGEPLAVRLIGRTERVRDQHEDWLGAVVEQPAARIEATLARSGGLAERPDEGFAQCTLDVLVRDVRDGLRMAPALAERLQAYRPEGTASARLHALRLEGRRVMEVSVDGSQAAFALPGETPGEKPVGVPAELKLRLEEQAGETADAITWRLVASEAKLAGLTMTEASGELRTKPGGGASEALPPALVGWLGEPVTIDAASLRGRGTASCTVDLERLWPAWARWRERLGLSGSMAWEAEVSGNHESGHFTARLDGEGLTWSMPTGVPSAPRLVKSAGVPAAMAVDAAVTAGPDGPGRRVDGRLDADVDGNRLTVEGTALCDGLLEGACRIGDADLVASVALERPDRLAALAPEAAVTMTEGQARIDVAGERRDGALRATGGYVRLHEVGITSNGSELALDGAAVWDDAGIRVPGLAWKWGESGGRIDGQASFLREGMRGDVHLATDRLDVEDLKREVDGFAGPLQAASANAAGGTGEAGELTPRRVLEYLARSDVRVNGEIGALASILPPGILVESNDVSYELTARHGPVAFTFAGTADGGAVRGEVRTRADAPEPAMRLTYTAERIRPGPLVDAYLRTTFPGMTASGPVTIIDESNQKLFPAPGELNYPTGTGELIIEGGRLAGRAAPKVVTRIFPGLNLATFDFAYMHSWFRKDELGRIHHQMIYKGRYYHMYMDGYGGPQGFRYEVGIDFFADFDSKYWAESGQGRIPLFTKTGRLQPDGSIADEVVTYMPQSFFETVLVRNNPVFTAYHAVRKRVREEK